MWDMYPGTFYCCTLLIGVKSFAMHRLQVGRGQRIWRSHFLQVDHSNALP